MKQRTHAWLAIRAIALLDDAGAVPALVKLLKPHVKTTAIGSWIPDLADSKKGSGDIDNHVFKMKPQPGEAGTKKPRASIVTGRIRTIEAPSMNPFVERHQASISSTLSCFDRVVVTGTLPDICHPRAMASFLDYHKARLFDFPRWAEPLREELRENAERVAAEAGLQIELIFIDEQFGLCYVRVPSWAPFRLQVYFNGHSWLARQLLQASIAFEMLDNAFTFIADPATAQELAGALSAPMLHEHLALWAQRFCPVLRHFRSGYHWSFMQAEYATDVLFHRQAELQPLYEAIVRTAVHIIQAEHVATFLGRKLTGAYQGEIGNDFSTRIQGTRYFERSRSTCRDLVRLEVSSNVRRGVQEFRKRAPITRSARPHPSSRRSTERRDGLERRLEDVRGLRRSENCSSEWGSHGTSSILPAVALTRNW